MGFASETWRSRRSLVAGVVAALTFAVYLPALRNGFVWDDIQYVTRNSFIRSINGNLFKTAFLTFQADNWHPLTWISHAIDYSLWGLNPVGHHLTNIILHAINTFLVVLLVTRLLEATRGSTEASQDFLSRTSRLTLHDSRFVLIAAATTGLLFGLHPLHVESVAWVSERKDLLCALFFMLSMMSYVKYAGSYMSVAGSPESRTNNNKEADKKQSFLNKHYLLALGFFVLALLSKPMAVTLPVVLLILDWLLFRRLDSLKTFLAVSIEKLPFFILALISSFLTILAQRGGGAMDMMQPVPLSTRMFVAARSLIIYLQKMIAPVNLVPYYPYPEGVSLLSFEYLVPAVLAIGITLFCAAIAKRQKLWLLAWGYFVVTLLPVLGLVQVGNQAMADRYTYLPSLGPFFMVGLVAAVLFEKGRTSRRSSLLKTGGAVAAIALFTLISYATIQQIGVWRNNVRFWNYVISQGLRSAAESSKSAMAHNNLGLAYASEGQWDRAKAEFQTALRLKPDYVEPHYNLGVAYASQSRLDEAIAEYQTALRLKPDSAGAHNNLGIAYALQGRFDLASTEFRTTSRLKPNDAEPHVNLGIAYASQGRPDEAIAEYQRALQLKPDSAGVHYSLGNLYASQGKLDRAVAEYQAALRLKPDFHEARRSLNSVVSRRH